jgi:uncharacterized protein (DUF1778 family)
MAGAAKSNARLNVRLPSRLKRVIEEAASQLGQSLSDFAVSTLVETARRVVRESNVTKLSHRDRDLFLSALERRDAKPNRALAAASRRYKKRIR